MGKSWLDKYDDALPSVRRYVVKEMDAEIARLTLELETLRKTFRLVRDAHIDGSVAEYQDVLNVVTDEEL